LRLKKEGKFMEVKHTTDCEDVKIDKFPFKGKMMPVIDTTVRWLSRHGDDGTGYPEYGLRFFTIGPGGQIPIHNHFYHQTMYVLSGRFECWRFDLETEAMLDKKEAGPGDFIYIPSMEPHGMRNLSDSQAGTFLCCICNVYDEKPV